MVNGEPEAAAEAWSGQPHFGGNEDPSAASFALAQLSLLAAERGDWSTAENHAIDSWALVATAGLPEYGAPARRHVGRA